MGVVEAVGRRVQAGIGGGDSRGSAQDFGEDRTRECAESRFQHCHLAHCLLILFGGDHIHG